MNDIDLNTSADLPSSSGSTAGATVNSMGDACKADLKNGYCDCAERDDNTLSVALDDNKSGFLGRPSGYER